MERVVGTHHSCVPNSASNSLYTHRYNCVPFKLPLINGMCCWFTCPASGQPFRVRCAGSSGIRDGRVLAAGGRGLEPVELRSELPPAGATLAARGGAAA